VWCHPGKNLKKEKRERRKKKKKETVFSLLFFSSSFSPQEQDNFFLLIIKRRHFKRYEEKDTNNNSSSSNMRFLQFFHGSQHVQLLLRAKRRNKILRRARVRSSATFRSDSDKHHEESTMAVADANDKKKQKKGKEYKNTSHRSISSSTSRCQILNTNNFFRHHFQNGALRLLKTNPTNLRRTPRVRQCTKELLYYLNSQKVTDIRINNERQRLKKKNIIIVQNQEYNLTLVSISPSPFYF
jgi:hypothetical protein